jgi:arylsulfatase
MVGASFGPVLDDALSPSLHREQHYESLGSRGYYRDGWEIVALHNIGARIEDSIWELYHLDEDPTEITDLAAAYPELVAELAEEFDRKAWSAQVYPLVDQFQFFAGVRPPSDDALTQPLRLTLGLATIDRYRAAKMIHDRSFSIVVDLEQFTAGDAGILVSHGSLGAATNCRSKVTSLFGRTTHTARNVHCAAARYRREPSGSLRRSRHNRAIIGASR